MDTGSRTELGWLLWRKRPADAIALLHDGLSAVRDDMKGQVKVLAQLVLFEEWQARIDSNKPPYHANSLDDLFFHNATDTFNTFKDACSALVRLDPSDQWARMTEALAYFASGQHAKAQANFQTVGNATGNTMANAVRFDEPFFSSLLAMSDTDLHKGLPPIEMAKVHPFNGDNILYLSCNATYFDDFAVPLLRSLNVVSDGIHVHIHLMDSAEAHTTTAIQFCSDLSNIESAISVERPDFSGKDLIAMRSYFHAIRFIRFYDHLKHYNKTLWLMDVDGLFNRSPDAIFSCMDDSDVAMRVRPGRLEPWNQFNACMVGVKPTKTGLHYIFAVSAYILYFYNKGEFPCGIDQLAMYAAFHDLQRKGQAPSLHFLDETVLDYDYRDDGIVWCSSGATKYTALNRDEVENDPDASAFDRAFARYASMTP